tara:strand:+ start:171 stop:719 length:549 start_codon:yes stop_codon:yes gene_type:complete
MGLFLLHSLNCAVTNNAKERNMIEQVRTISGRRNLDVTFFKAKHVQLAKSCKPIIHVYANPSNSEEGDKWFELVSQQKSLVRIPHKTYIHPDAGLGYWDICYLEKGVFEKLQPLNQGDLYPALIHKHNQVILTVAACVKALQEYDYKGTPINSCELWAIHPHEKGSMEWFKQLTDNKFDVFA